MNLSTMQENHWREDLRVERTQGRREHQQPPQMQQKRQQEHRRPRQQVPGDHRRPQQQGRGLDWNLRKVSLPTIHLEEVWMDWDGEG